ncbi:MAG TPA: hypothetical protein DCY80_16650, partial [Solibacterales bacterium]|nr:hypothetical protein [Bryobacterales bacterium]
AARLFASPEPSPALDAARNTETGRAFLRFARAPLWRAIPASHPEGATVVTATDLRFGDPEDGRFTAEILIDAAGRVLAQEFRY